MLISVVLLCNTGVYVECMYEERGREGERERGREGEKERGRESVCVCVCLLGDVWRVGRKMEGEWLKEGRIDLCPLHMHAITQVAMQARPHTEIPRLPQGVPDFLKGSI